MGKVYDALRRAEAERRRRASGREPAEPAPLWTPPAAPPARRSAPPAAADHAASRAPARAEALDRQRVSLLQPESFPVEQFRTLRARLDALALERPLRSLAVTSALAAEGKTLTAVNLALVNAMHVGCRVLLVDCDLRRPTVHAALGLAPAAGLVEVLTSRVQFEDAVVKLPGTNLEVLAGPGVAGNPSELLASERMRSLLAELVAAYDRVILDTPAALAVPDARTVSELAEGTVLVVRADSTPRADVEAALEFLDRRRVLGVVLNGASVEAERYGY